MIKVQAIEFETDWFLIPNGLYIEFTKLIEEFYNLENEDLQLEIADQIENSFGKFKTGGDLNIVQLYIES